MNTTAHTPALSSVVVLKLQEFTRKPVADQVKLKARLDALVTFAIRPLPAAARIVLDAPEGVAVVVLGSPGVALDLAKRSQLAAEDLPLCIGVNHGPVMSALDVHRGPGLVGDGLAAATTLANAARPGRFVTSRSFREALKASDPDRVRELGPAGTYTDAQVRAHELFALDWRPAFALRLRLIAFGALTVAAIIGAGFAARFARLALEPPPAPPPPPPRPAVIHLQVTPRGEVFIDGVLRGTCPPLTEIEVDPGPRTIEIRNSPNPPLRLEVSVGPGEEMTISHSFVAPKAPVKSAPKSTAKRTEKKAEKKVEKKSEEPHRKTPGDYWRQFRRDIGF